MKQWRIFNHRFTRSLQRGCLIVALLVGVSLPAWAADYYVPSGGTLPPGACSLTMAALVTCSGLTLGNNDRIIVTAPVTLQVNGNFSYGGSVRINQGGTASNLTLNVTGSWSGGNGGHFNANINAAAVAFQQNSYIGGNLVASGGINANTGNNQFAGNITAAGNISLGQGSSVAGSLNSTGGTLATANNVSIVGNVSTRGNITLNQGSSVGGSVATSNGTISTQGNVSMGGGVSAYGTVALGSNNTVTTGGISSANAGITVTSGEVAGNIVAANGGFTSSAAVTISGNISVNGNISLGQGTIVTGNANSAAGTFTTGNQVQVGGNVAANGTINLGFQSQVAGNVQSANGGVITNNEVQIGGSIDASGNISLGYMSAVTGDVQTDAGGVTLSNGVTIGGGIDASGNVHLGYRSDVEGNVHTDGGVTTENEAHIGGNIVAGGDVSLNYMTAVDGNINTPGAVSGNNSSVGGYVNAGSTSGIDGSQTVICDTDPILGDSNASPCPGFEPEPDVHHYRLQFSDTTLTCEPLSVLVQACADANCTTLTAITGSADVVANGPVAVSPATASFVTTGSAGVALNLPAAGTYTLGLSNIGVPAAGGLVCDPASCQNHASEASFVWRSSALAPVIGPQTAGLPFTVELVAQACAGVFQSQSLGVDLSLDCDDPSSCSSGGSLLSINSVPLAEAPASTTTNLGFNASSIAAMTVNYDDAGSIVLKARAQLPGGAQIAGASNAFVVKPATIGFNFSNPVTYSAPGVLARAGDDLAVVLSARSAGPGNPVTPNFGNENVPALLTLLGSATVVDPNPGVSTGPVFVLNAFTRTAPGTFTSTQVRYGEVGLARFSAEVVGGDYLGAGNVLVESGLDTGLFIPWEFSVQSSSVIPACNVVAPGFSYMGQDFTVNLTARAWARVGDNSLNVAANYAGALAQATATLVAADEASATDLSTRLAPSVLPLLWTAGEGSTSNALVSVNKLAASGPYLELQLGAQVQQQGAALGLTDFNAAVANCADTNVCNALALGLSHAVVLGRMTLSDTYGPESEAAPVNLETQYWDGARYTRAANISDGIYDACTPVDYTRLEALSVLGSSLRGGNISTLANGRSTVGALYWTAPFEPGYFQFRYNAAGQPWLRDELGQSPEYDDTGNPTARATFGSFRGHDRILNWQILPP